LKLKK
jgi:hypothetical protein